MNIFKQKETTSENIAFIGICSGLIAVISLIASFFPLSNLFLPLIIPFFACMPPLFCKKGYSYLFLFTSFALSLIAGLYSALDTIFFIFPSILIGFAFGICRKIKISESILLFLLSLLELGLFYICLYLIKGIFSVDIGETILSLIKQNKEGAKDALPLFYLAYSFAQVGLTALFLDFELPKLNLDKKSKDIPYLGECLSIVFGVVAMIIGLYVPWLGLLLLGLSSYWAIYSAINVFYSQKWYVYLSLGILFFIGIFLFAYLYQFYLEKYGIILIGIVFISFPISSLINEFSKLRKKEN